MTGNITTALTDLHITHTLPDGTIGLLYESDGTVITYEDFDIEDVAKGAAIGNIWCTDENGTVADVTMTSDISKKLTVNGLNCRYPRETEIPFRAPAPPFRKP